MRKHLTAKQRRFVEEYLVDLNATQAALRAGYSPRNTDKIGPQLLGKSRVAQAIQELMDRRAKRTDITADRVLRELACLGYSNVLHYRVDDENNLLLMPDAPPEAMRAVSSVKRKTRIIPRKDGEPIIERELEFRLWDKNTALTNLGRHLKLFLDRFELIGPLAETVKHMAEAHGMSVEEVLAEAEAIARGAKS